MAWCRAWLDTDVLGGVKGRLAFQDKGTEVRDWVGVFFFSPSLFLFLLLAFPKSISYFLKHRLNKVCLDVMMQKQLQVGKEGP